MPPLTGVNAYSSAYSNGNAYFDYGQGKQRAPTKTGGKKPKLKTPTLTPEQQAQKNKDDLWNKFVAAGMKDAKVTSSLVSTVTGKAVDPALFDKRDTNSKDVTVATGQEKGQVSKPKTDQFTVGEPYAWFEQVYIYLRDNPNGYKPPEQSQPKPIDNGKIWGRP